MRLARIRRAAVVTLAGVLLHCVPALASSVSVPLDQTSLGGVVVDDVNEHVFVSNPSGNSVAVFDFSGNPVKTISGLPGADGMVIHGSTLYVADSTGGTIEGIDLSSLEDTGSVATGLDDPTVLAYAGGELWTTSDAGNGFSRLTSVTLNGTVTVVPVSNATEYQHPVVATTPADPNLLYVGGGLGADSLYELDVSSGAPTILASTNVGVSDLAVSPDGTRVIPANSGSDLYELSPSTLTQDGTAYLMGYGASAMAVAVSPGDGGLLATGNSNYYIEPTPEVTVFSLGGSTPTSSVELQGADGISARGLALSADGSTAFAVGEIAGAGRPLRLWTSDLGSSSTATTTALATAQSPSSTDNQVTLTATVSPTDGGGSVSFYGNYALISGCESVPLVDTPSGETATCTTTSLPASTGDVVSAYYSGNSTYATSFASVNMAVELPTGSDYTWSGDEGSADNFGGQYWNNPANWVQGVIPYGTVGTLTFPQLYVCDSTSCDCSTSCGCGYGYCSAINNIPGLTANALVADSSYPYEISGDGLTLGAGGLTVEGELSGATTPSTLNLPLTLGAPQSWTIDDAATPFAGAVSGDEPLTVAFNAGSSLIPSGGIEVGNVTATGAGGFYLNGNMAVNATSSRSVELEAGAGIEADRSDNSVGAVTVDANGWLSVGGIADGGSTLDVEGDLRFNSNSELDLSVASPGTEAGLDYSQLAATGDVNLSGAALYVSQGADNQGYCDNLNPGDAITLLRASGSITGTFANYPNGASVDIANGCDTSTEDATGTISYSANAVTLTITNGGNAGGNGGSGGTGANPPVEVAPPSMSGTAQEAQTLQVDPGTWEQETSFSYSWWACDTSGNCAQIPNASSSTLQLTAAQLGDQIGAIVTADGPGGSNYDYTNLSDPVTAEPVPTVSGAPTISGTNSVGDTLSATSGSWSNSPTSYAYQWERCSATASGCSTISGATTQTYVLASADSGSTLEIQVTASNYGGKSSPARSSATGIVPAATTATAPSTSPAAVTAAIERILVPSGKVASLAEVISHRGYTFSFHAPAAGKLAVTWTATVKHRTVTVAKGGANATQPQALKVTVHLTAAGAAALHQHPRLKIKSVVSFTANGSPRVIASRTFTLAGHVVAKKAMTVPDATATTLRRITGHVDARRGHARGPVRVRRSDFRQA